MAILKTFTEYASLIDNSEDVVAVVGELSSDSKTFVRDYKTYTKPDFTGIALHVMESLGDDLLPVPANDQQQIDVMTVSRWVYSKARSGELGPSATTFAQLFETGLGANYVLLSAVTMIQDVNGHWYPGSVQFAPKGRETQDNFTAWFADERFSNEFDKFVSLVITPLDNVDGFFNTAETVRALLADVTTSDTMEKVYTARGKYPYTKLSFSPFNWVDPSNADVTIETTWTIVMYGRAGDNLDSIKEAIIEHVLGESSHTAEEWAEIFPDIFKSTEFIFSPNYFTRGIEPQAHSTGIYSGIVNMFDSVRLMIETAKGPGYEPSFIGNNAINISSNWRSLPVTGIAGPDNRDGYASLRQLHPTLLNTPSTSSDFGHMAPETREFSITITDMVRHAETLTPSSVVPSGYTRVERDGIWYLALSKPDVLLLVTSKYSVDQIATTLGIPSDVDGRYESVNPDV